jgi:hypothetical protein
MPFCKEKLKIIAKGIQMVSEVLSIEIYLCVTLSIFKINQELLTLSELLSSLSVYTFLCSLLWIIVCLFVHLRGIVLDALLQLTSSDYRFGNYNLRLLVHWTNSE